MADEKQDETPLGKETLDQEPARGWIDDVYNRMDDSYTDRLLARIRGSEGAEEREKSAAPEGDQPGAPPPSG